MAPYVWGAPPAGAKIPSYSEKWDPSDKGKRPTCIAKFCFQYIETRYETGKQRFFHRFQCLNDVCKREFNIIANSGFKNLENHMDTCISVAGTDKRVREAIEELQKSNSTAKQQRQMQNFFQIPSDRDKAIHSIMRWFFVDNDLPISTLDKQSFKSNSIHQQHWPSSSTMRKYLLKLVPIVEKKISNMLPNKFACHFDGWTAHNVHYLAVYAAFLQGGELKELLLSISPLANHAGVDRAVADALADIFGDDSIERDEEEEEEEEEEEVSNFTAQHHREHIDRLLKDYYIGNNIEENVTNLCVPSSDVVKYKHFKQGVIKIQKGKERQLTREEKRAVRCLLLSDEEEEVDDKGFDDEVASPATKRRKKVEDFLDGDASDSQNGKSKYMDCRFILGTNNTVEQCFSHAKQILSVERAGMTPYSFEVLLFLKLHSNLWGLREVAAAIREADKDEKEN
ncbi:hypothetical protein MPSEU_000827200 [Mayamaea pseudoterrestris]|nr:hypothetical protein MPSEU_000827200 [Mayamaea pseudoterrestris]